MRGSQAIPAKYFTKKCRKKDQNQPFLFLASSLVVKIISFFPQNNNFFWRFIFWQRFCSRNNNSGERLSEHHPPTSNHFPILKIGHIWYNCPPKSNLSSISPLSLTRFFGNLNRNVFHFLLEKELVMYWKIVWKRIIFKS